MLRIGDITRTSSTLCRTWRFTYCFIADCDQLICVDERSCHRLGFKERLLDGRTLQCHRGPKGWLQ